MFIEQTDTEEMDTTRSTGMSTSVDMSTVGENAASEDKTDRKEEGHFSLLISQLKSLGLLHYFFDHSVVDVVQMKVG